MAGNSCFTILDIEASVTIDVTRINGFLFKMLTSAFFLDAVSVDITTILSRVKHSNVNKVCYLKSH